jgi:hypothetical protein
VFDRLFADPEVSFVLVANYSHPCRLDINDLPIVDLHAHARRNCEPTGRMLAPYLAFLASALPWRAYLSLPLGVY